MPKVVTVTRSASDISLASTVALEDCTHNTLSVDPAQSDVLDTVQTDEATAAAAAAAARQLEIEEMRNFVRKQKTKLPVLMDNYMDFVGHQIVTVMNTIASYNEATAGMRVSRHDEKRMKLEHTFSLKVRFNILPAFQDLATHINHYSKQSSMEERKVVCQHTKQKLEHIYKLIAYLIDEDNVMENLAKCQMSKSTARASSSNGYVQHQVEIRCSMLGYCRIYRAAEELYRAMKFS